MIDKKEIRQICFYIICCEILYGFDLKNKIHVFLLLQNVKTTWMAVNKILKHKTRKRDQLENEFI